MKIAGNPLGIYREHIGNTLLRKTQAMQIRFDIRRFLHHKWTTNEVMYESADIFVARRPAIVIKNSLVIAIHDNLV